MTPHVSRLRRRLAHVDAPAILATLNRDEFEGYASLFGVPDGAGDVVAPGAFAKSLKARGVARVRMLYQHFAHEPIGAWQEIPRMRAGFMCVGVSSRISSVAAMCARCSSKARSTDSPSDSKHNALAAIAPAACACFRKSSSGKFRS